MTDRAPVPNRAACAARRAPTVVVTALAVAVLLLALGTPPAGAGQTPPPRPGGAASPIPRITLVGQDPWSPVGGQVTFRLSITNPPPQATVSFSVHQAITARNTFDDIMAGGSLGPVLSQLSHPVDVLQVEDEPTRLVTLGLQSPDEGRQPDRLNVRRPGVYPVAIDLRDADDRTVDSFRTALVVAETGRESVTEKLRVVWAWPVAAAPSHLPSGEPDRDVVAALRPDGRLGRMVAALRAVPDVPVTLAPVGETVEAWSAFGQGDASIQFAANVLLGAPPTHQVLDGTYVPVHLPSLLEHGLGLAVDENQARGSAVLQGAFGEALDRRTRIARPVSTASLARLRAGGVDRVIVGHDALGPTPEPRLTPAQPVLLNAGTGGAFEPVTALVTDPGLQTLLTGDRPAALRAQLVLAGLAMVALEAPSVPRVVTLLNPDQFDAPADLYTTILSGLRDSPYLRAVTAREAFDTVPLDPPTPTVNPSAATADRVLAAASPPSPPVSAAAYRNQRTRLNSFGAITRPGDPAVGHADRSLVASVSSAWASDVASARATAHLRVVDRVIGEFLGLIEVPDPRTITLTSRSGEIPLTFRNDTGQPVRLRASLSSAKLFFPHGAVFDFELPPRASTVRVAVEARTSGTFPLDLEVTSIDGVLPVSERRLEVRSTFVSTVGVVLMVSAAAFLAIWWGFDLHRRHRRRRTVTAES